MLVKIPRLLAVIAFIMLTGAANGQRSQYAEVSISSPTSASLGKYADIPVNCHTGTLDVSIPIYTVTEGPLKLPIVLKYFSGGLKVEEAASWVGAGWSLSAGGVITRVVRGAPDEAGTSNTQKGHFSDYGYSSYLTIGQAGGYPYSTGPTAPFDFNFQNSVYDGQPDLYSFNFGEYTGKFFFDDARRPVVVDGQDLQIEYYYPRDDPNDPANNGTSMSANIYGFSITVPSGDKYFFGLIKGETTSVVDPVETTFPYSAGHTAVTDNVISSWYLNKIVSADGMFTIKFTYEAESFSNYKLALFPVDAETIPVPREYDLVKNNIAGVRLNRISFSNGHIDFTPASQARVDLARYINGEGLSELANTQAKALAEISIEDNTGLCKKFSFSYGYFEDNTTALSDGLNSYDIESDKKHLRLDSILEASCDGSIILKPYKITYNGNFVPRSLSFDRDHWGFYNAAGNINTLIPRYSVDTFTFVPGADRDTKWPAMQSGALTTLSYPTGGSSQFEYEANTTWVNDTRTTETYTNGYSVGFDGSNTANYTGITFSANHYRVVLSNNTCPGTSPCGAGAFITNSLGTQVFAISAPGGETSTQVMTIPAGTYNIGMSRSDVRSGTSGAQVAFYEITEEPVDSNVIVGGLRIKNITKNNGTGVANEVIRYTYNEASGHSSGILYSKPTYVQIARNDMLSLEGNAGNTSSTNFYPHGCLAIEGTRQFYYKSPVSVLPMATTQGNHIGYNEVTVSHGASGYTVFRYYGSNYWDANNKDVCNRNVNPLQCDFTIPNLPAAPPAYEYQRGMLKYEGYFNNNGIRLKDILYTYTFDSSAMPTPSYIVERHFGALLGTQYETKGYWKKEEKTIETECVPGGTCLQKTKVRYYESQFHHQPTREADSTSKGELFEVRNKYAFDFRTTCDTINSGISAYNSACSACDASMNAILFTTSARDIRFMARTDNRVCRADARKNFAALQKVNFTGPANTFDNCHESVASGSGSDLKPILGLQKRRNNALIEKAQLIGGKVTFGEFFGYAYSGVPSTIPFLSKIQVLSPALPLTDFTPSTVASGNTALTKDGRYADELIYLYVNGNIAERRKAGDVNSVYLWGYNSRFPVAKITGSTYAAAMALISQAVLDNATGQYTDQQMRTELDKLRAGLPGALVTTYTYSPICGITSETDPAGRSNYYEYDGLGRLRLIRDNDGKITRQFEYQYQAPLTQ